MKNFSIYNGGVKLFFGENTVIKTKKHLSRYHRLLVVTGRSSAKVSGALDDIRKILEEHGIEYMVWDKALPNPTDSLVEELTRVYREGLFEGFIAIGGGSVIDLTKAARVLVVGGGSIKEYLYGEKIPPEQQPFLMAVNLTHGTGSEIDRFAVVTIEETKEKLGFSAGYPTVSVDDPKYTLTLPRSQTIYTSMDAFAHAVESATSNYASPYTVLLAEEAVRVIVEYLPKTLENPRSIENRYWLLYASMIAGIGIDHGVTHYGHLLEHLLTGYNPRLAHGAGLAIIHRKLIGVIYKYFPETMARILKPLDPSLKPVPDDSVKAVKAYEAFLEKIGFKERLGDYGFDKDVIKELTELYDKLFKTRYANLAAFKLSREEAYEILVELI